MKRKPTIVFLVLFAIAANLKGQVIEKPTYIPQGWRTPNSKDIKVGSGWQDFISQNADIVPYYIGGDFNGDRKEDFAWLLINRNNNSWDLYAFLKDQAGNFTNYLLGSQGPVDKNPKYLSSSAISECIIQKAEKGEQLCLFGNNEKITKKITTQYDAIVFSVYDIGQPIFIYFDKVQNKFITYWSCFNDGD